MIRFLLAAFVALAAVPRADSGVVDPTKISAVALSSDADTPQVGRVVAVVRARKVSGDPDRHVSRSVDGSGTVSGNAYIPCPSNGNGYRSGMLRLSGSVRVSNSDGVSGDAQVSGFISVSGSCTNGSGSLSGSGRVDGTASLYRDGRYLGTANVSDHVFINTFGSGSAYVSTWVRLHGSF